MHLPFGLGIWWITLGLIASIVDRYRQVPNTRVPTAVVT
jgi:hypothetical protein